MGGWLGWVGLVGTIASLGGLWVAVKSLGKARSAAVMAERASQSVREAILQNVLQREIAILQADARTIGIATDERDQRELKTGLRNFRSGAGRLVNTVKLHDEELATSMRNAIGKARAAEENLRSIDPDLDVIKVTKQARIAIIQVVDDLNEFGGVIGRNEIGTDNAS